jgi:hypothetical protein
VSQTTTKHPLSRARSRLAELLSSIHFGRILDLHVRGGEPVLDDPRHAPRIVRTVKLSGSNQPRPRIPFDPLQKREIADLLRLLDDVGDGVIGRLEIAHGLPLFAEVHEPAAA